MASIAQQEPTGTSRQQQSDQMLEFFKLLPDNGNPLNLVLRSAERFVPRFDETPETGQGSSLDQKFWVTSCSVGRELLKLSSHRTISYRIAILRAPRELRSDRGPVEPDFHSSRSLEELYVNSEARKYLRPPPLLKLFNLP